MDAVLFVAAGGALGALCRYFTGMAAAAVFGPFFPVGTLIVNIVGCFVIGSVYASQPSGLLGEFILQGFCGALTTFPPFLWTVSGFFSRAVRSELPPTCF